MNLNKLTDKAQEAVVEAQRVAESRQHTQVEPEHLLAALVVQDNGVVPAILDKLGVSARASHPAPGCHAQRVRAGDHARAAGLCLAALPAGVRIGSAGGRAAQGRLRLHRALPARDGRRPSAGLQAELGVTRDRVLPGAAGDPRRPAGHVAEPRERRTSRWRSTAAT